MKRFLILAALLSVAACGGDKLDESTDAEIFVEARAKLEKKSYAAAGERFEDVDKLYPASPLVSDALVLAAYSYYMDGDYAGAIADIDRFLRFQPGHPYAAYMLYLKGMSFMAQASDAQRDASMTQEALAAFNFLIERFPNSEYAENAKNKVVILRNYMAGKLMFVARQDQREKNWPSSITRLNALTLAFYDTAMMPEALYRLAVAYSALGMRRQVAVHQELLRVNYPDSEWLAEAMKL
ncbi:MAG: outer membrane protein assembly factor BamD [Rickettsiales bacterium]|jgi:outer membrane protein assembly factor BamD|nr:outer membrane protein assembly factor BamD [Rickettsiales bacterium]